MLAGHANSNTTDNLKKSPNPTAPAAIAAATTAEAAEADGVSAEDALNLHERKLKFRAGKT